MGKEKKLEQLRNALGMTAEMALILYRAAIEAGATPEATKFGLNHPPMSWQYVEIPDAAEV